MTAIAFILKNKVLILIVIIVLLIASISGITYLYKAAKDESNRWQQNYNASETQITRFKTKSGKDAVFIQEQQLTIRELKKSGDSAKIQLYEQSKDMRNKDKQIEQLLSVTTETRIDSVIIPIHDTVIVRDNDTITRIAPYKSKWLDVVIAIHDNNLEVISYESRDNLIIVLKWYKDGKWFLPRWFEKRKYAAVIKSENPNSIIKQSENIRITGRRGR